MKYLVLIQARMGSSRLPGKVLMDICGKPDLQWVVERVQRSKVADGVMVVTSIGQDNLPLIRLCTELGIRVFAGAEQDVLDRYYQAAKLLRPEYVVRVTADCPLFDWRYLDWVAGRMEADTDYIWLGEDGYPDGLDLEIVRFEALKRSWEEAGLLSEREHVTMYIKNHPEAFRIKALDFPVKNIGHYRWTLDEGRDFEMINEVYRHFTGMGKEDFVTEDVAAFLECHPEVAAINAGIARNEGLMKSIAGDRHVAGSQGV